MDPVLSSPVYDSGRLFTGRLRLSVNGDTLSVIINSISSSGYQEDVRVVVTGEQLSCGRPRDAFARTSG